MQTAGIEVINPYQPRGKVNLPLAANGAYQEVGVAVLGIEQLVDLGVASTLPSPSAITAIGGKQLRHRLVAHHTVLPPLDKPVAAVILPHFVVAVLIDKVLRLGVVAVFFLDLYLGGVFLHHVGDADGRLVCKHLMGKGESDALAPVVEVELAP